MYYYVREISFSAVLILLIVALAFYLLGRYRGRAQASNVPQYYGPPAPPFGAQSHDPEK